MATKKQKLKTQNCKQPSLKELRQEFKELSDYLSMLGFVIYMREGRNKDDYENRKMRLRQIYQLSEIKGK
jgi:hypothetical protein